MRNRFLAGSGRDAERVFGQSVRDRRERLGWSQVRLAEVITERTGAKFTQSMVAKTETGGRPIRLNEAFALASVFDEDLDAMLVLHDERYREEVREAEARLIDLEAQRDVINGAVLAIRAELDQLRAEHERRLDAELQAQLEGLSPDEQRAFLREHQRRLMEQMQASLLGDQQEGHG